VSILCLNQGQSYASKAVYQLLGHPRATPDALQGTHCQYVSQHTLFLHGRPSQSAQEVELQIVFIPPLALLAPQRPGGATGKGEPVPGSVVRV